jgi:hypothetical protein
MKWLKKKIRNWVEANEDEYGNSVKGIAMSRDVEAVSDAEPILNFRVFSAVGGQVVEFRRYDRKTDRSDTTTYIITKDQDFGEKIAKISNLEMLK